MENNRLLQILQRTVSENEIDKLSAHTLPHISEFNRSVILEMLQDKLLAQEEISEEKITALKNTLENYLQIYLPDQKRSGNGSYCPVSISVLYATNRCIHRKWFIILFHRTTIKQYITAL